MLFIIVYVIIVYVLFLYMKCPFVREMPLRNALHYAKNIDTKGFYKRIKFKMNLDDTYRNKKNGNMQII